MNSRGYEFAPLRVLFEFRFDRAFRDALLEFPLEVLKFEISVLKSVGEWRRRRLTPFRQPGLQGLLGRYEVYTFIGFFLRAHFQFLHQKIDCSVLVLPPYLG